MRAPDAPIPAVTSEWIFGHAAIRRAPAGLFQFRLDAGTWTGDYKRLRDAVLAADVLWHRQEPHKTETANRCSIKRDLEMLRELRSKVCLHCCPISLVSKEDCVVRHIEACLKAGHRTRNLERALRK